MAGYPRGRLAGLRGSQYPEGRGLSSGNHYPEGHGLPAGGHLRPEDTFRVSSTLGSRYHKGRFWGPLSSQYPEGHGLLKGNLPLGFLLGLVEAGYVLIPFAVGLLAGEKIQLKPISLTILSVSLMAGIGEELAFRGVFISTLMREWKNQNKFKNAAALSGITFGLVHATNLIMGADLVHTMLQVVGSMCVGIIFAAIYMRSGSLLPCMFYHTVHDVIAIAASDNVSEEGVITGAELSWTAGLEIVLAIVMAAIAFYILRAANNEEMRKLWNRKWKNEKVETSVQNEGDQYPI